MKSSLIKISLVGLVTTSLFAGEVEYGHGTFELTGGFLGLTNTQSTNISTYSILEQHKNIFSSTWFYKYNFTWYDSDNLVQGQNNFNNLSNSLSSSLPSSIVPSIDYRLQGLDANIVLGKDFIHKDENNYLGLGVLVGVSIPWIDSKKSSNNNDTTSSNAMNSLKKSETKLLTYKIGPNITFRKSLGNFFSVYGSGTYAYQTGTMKNNYANADLNVDGIFQSYDFGIRFQALSLNYKYGWITISPRLYATLGYRYTSWDLNDVNIDISGLNTQFSATDFNMNTSVGYFGVGYSF